MTFKLIIILFLFSLSLFQFKSCNNSEKKQDEIEEIFSIESRTELLFFYTKDSTYEQRTYFYENILYRNTDRGQYSRDGVQATFGMDKDDYEGFGIRFRKEATKEQKDALIKLLKSSPVVFRVYQNVTLNEINDLPNSKTPEVDSTPTSRPGENLKEIVELKNTDKVEVKNKHKYKLYDLVIIFKQGDFYKEKRKFADEVLFTPRADGRGYEQDSVIDTITVLKDKYDGFLINFRNEATREQREKLKKAIESSPIIYKVYENAVPNKIKDLPPFP